MQSLSVIIPTYNRAETILAAVQSVAAQCPEDTEIVVVDDCSQDDTEKRLGGLKDPRIRYIRLERNSGACAARNVGARMSKGKWLAFHDSDDLWLPNKLSMYAEARASYPDSRLVFGGFIRLKGSVPQSIKIPRELASRGRQALGSAVNAYCWDSKEILHYLLMKNFISTQTILIDRDLFFFVTGFDPAMPRFQDWEFMIRCCKLVQFKMAAVKCPTVLSIEMPDSISKNTSSGIIARRLIMRKHGDAYDDDVLAKVSARLGLMLRLLNQWIRRLHEATRSRTRSN